MRDAGLDPAEIPTLARGREELMGYLEVHIEQGPVLLEEGLPVGIVSAIAGSVRSAVTITGTAGHAGTVPMARRHDAAAAAAELVLYVEKRCAQAPDAGRHRRAARRSRRRDQHHSRPLRAHTRYPRRR